MKRGEIWTVAGGPDYAGKPRPAIILQDDAFDATASITICPFTTHAVDAPLMRLSIEPSERNGLRSASHVMIDKITTVSKKKLESRIGRLSDEDIVRVNRAVVVFLGLAGRSKQLADAQTGSLVHQLDQTVLFRIGQRAEQDSVHDAEHRCRCADAKCERQGGHDRETWSAQQCAPSIAEVTKEVFNEGRSELVARALLGTFHPTKLDQGLPVRLVWRHAGSQVLLSLAIDVELDLFVEPAL